MVLKLLPHGIVSNLQDRSDLGKYFNLPATHFWAPGSLKLACCVSGQSTGLFQSFGSQDKKLSSLSTQGLSGSFLEVKLSLKSVTCFLCCFPDPFLFLSGPRTVTASLHVTMDSCVF